MSIIENILKSVVLDEAIITEKVALSTTAFRIRLKSDSIRKANFIPAPSYEWELG